jgi:hypothetical protein
MQSATNILNVCNHTSAVWTRENAAKMRGQPGPAVAIRLGALIGTYPLHVWGETGGALALVFHSLPANVRHVGVRDNLIPSLKTGLDALGLVKVRAAVDTLPEWPELDKIFLGGPTTGPGAWSVTLDKLSAKDWSRRYRGCFTSPVYAEELRSVLGNDGWRRGLAVAVMMDDFNREQSTGDIRTWFDASSVTNSLSNRLLLGESADNQESEKLAIALVKEVSASDDALASICKSWLELRSAQDKTAFANRFLRYLSSVRAIDWPVDKLPPGQ